VLDCNKCAHIDMTEDEQNDYYRTHGWKPNHICLRHMIRLVHHGLEPILRPYRDELKRNGMECYTFKSKLENDVFIII